MLTERLLSDRQLSLMREAFVKLKEAFLMDNIGKAIGLSERMVSVENYVSSKINVNKRDVNIITEMKDELLKQRQQLGDTDEEFSVMQEIFKKYWD